MINNPLSGYIGVTMLHRIFFIVITSFSFSALAFDVQFIDPCSNRPLISEQFSYVRKTNVGEMSLRALDENQVIYQGTAQGLSQIFGSPIGMDAMVVISDNEMLSYGWCFEVDGKIPEVYPDSYIIKPTTKNVKWFYGYAHYLDGKWVGQCLKNHSRRPEMSCPAK